MTEIFKAFEACKAPKTLLSTLMERCANVRPTEIIQKTKHTEGYVSFSISGNRDWFSMCLWSKGKDEELISVARFILQKEDYLALCALKPCILASYGEKQ